MVDAPLSMTMTGGRLMIGLDVAGCYTGPQEPTSHHMTSSSHAQTHTVQMSLIGLIIQVHNNMCCDFGAQRGRGKTEWGGCIKSQTHGGDRETRYRGGMYVCRHIPSGARYAAFDRDNPFSLKWMNGNYTSITCNVPAPSKYLRSYP